MSTATLAHPRPDRCYLVLVRPVGATPDVPIAVLGTIRAPDRRAGTGLAMRLAAERLPMYVPARPAAAWAVRWWVASACRRSWLVQALERDGAALLATERA